MRQRANFLRWLGDRLVKSAGPARAPGKKSQTAARRGQAFKGAGRLA
jgi:hypothetical protein